MCLRIAVKSVVLYVALALLTCGCAASGVPSRPDKLGLGRVGLNVPEPESWELGNGLKVRYLHNEEFPVVSGALLFHGGSWFEPLELAGLAGITGDQIREGAPWGFDPDDFDELLDNLGANIDSRFRDEYGSISFSCLSQDFDTLFPLFSRVVREPGFDRSRFALAKKLILEAMRRRRDDPETIASMTLVRLVYGKHNPYGRDSSPESIEKISIDDMRQFYSRFVSPRGAHLLITGAVPLDQIKNAVTKHFSDWHGPAEVDSEQLQYPAVDHKARPGLYVVERDFDQAAIYMGHLGPPRLTDDHFSIILYSHFLGFSGFGSVLNSEIRSKLGLAYSVWGGFIPGPVAGIFEIGLGTRNSEALRAIERVTEVIEETRAKLPPEQRVNDAKLNINRAHVFRFVTPSQILRRKAILELLSYPEGYDSIFLPRINGVTLGRLQDVAARWVKPEGLVIVVVGKLSAKELADKVGDRWDVFEVDFDYLPRIVRELS